MTKAFLQVALFITLQCCITMFEFESAYTATIVT